MTPFGFNPAGQAPIPDNTATIDFRPYFPAGWWIYEMIITGKDKSNNKAGAIEYRVLFEGDQQTNDANMLNYPNRSLPHCLCILRSREVKCRRISDRDHDGDRKIVGEITKELGPAEYRKRT